MAQMTHDEALEKVLKLLKLAEGTGNTHEAANAAARAQEIMDRYQIERGAVAAAEAARGINGGAASPPDEPISEQEYLDILRTTWPKWRAELAAAIARHNHCRVYLTRTYQHGVVRCNRTTGEQRARAAIAIIGRASDANAVRYLYQYLVREIERLCEKECPRGGGRTWANNFKRGAALEIAVRLHKQREETISQVRQEAHAASSEHALVHVDKALEALRERTTSVNEWLKKHMKLRKGPSDNSRSDYSAFNEGRKAARTIALGNARAGLGAGQKKIGDRG